MAIKRVSEQRQQNCRLSKKIMAGIAGGETVASAYHENKGVSSRHRWRRSIVMAAKAAVENKEKLMAAYQRRRRRQYGGNVRRCMK